MITHESVDRWVNYSNITNLVAFALYVLARYAAIPALYYVAALLALVGLVLVIYAIYLRYRYKVEVPNASSLNFRFVVRIALSLAVIYICWSFVVGG